MAKIQTKEEKRENVMLNEVCEMLVNCYCATVTIKENYQKTFIAELDKQVKARLFEEEATSWSVNDIVLFLDCLENELYKKEGSSVNKNFWKIIRKYNKNNCMSVDFKVCPFGLLYKAFLEIVYINTNLLFEVRDRIQDKEQETKIA